MGTLTKRSKGRGYEYVYVPDGSEQGIIYPLEPVLTSSEQIFRLDFPEEVPFPERGVIVTAKAFRKYLDEYGLGSLEKVPGRDMDVISEDISVHNFSSGPRESKTGKFKRYSYCGNHLRYSLQNHEWYLFVTRMEIDIEGVSPLKKNNEVRGTTRFGMSNKTWLRLSQDHKIEPGGRDPS